MSHLSTVHDHKTYAHASGKPHVELSTDGDAFTTAGYGSRFARVGLPRHQMPEEEMPRDIAYRLIKDDLSLDNNPALNLFRHDLYARLQEEEAEKLMSEAFSKNFIDYEEYPQSADIQNRCVSMIGNLFHAPTGESVGTSTIGSSEAIMLAVLALKKRWKTRRQAEGKPFDKPNMVMSSAVQVVWEKAMRYFDIVFKIKV
ncbi:glutamate decarboxylase, partial [Fusarium albosuccineum]